MLNLSPQIKENIWTTVAIFKSLKYLLIEYSEHN
jgi:hypothetical protein